MIFFTWQHWDVLDELSYQYYEIVLTNRVGPFEEGEAFELAVMNYGEEPYMLLQRNGLEWKFALSLTVGDLVDGPDNS